MPDEQHMTTQPALMVRSHHFSFIWIIPLATAIIAVCLTWYSYTSLGPRITIRFDNAEGIEAGTTKIKHKNANVGAVEAVSITSDLSHVIVTARMGKSAEPYLTKGARFWVVEPSISTKDLSGIGNIISGPYIEFEPDKDTSAAKTRDFTAEPKPAIAEPDAPGKVYTLRADQLGSIGQGTPILFHGIQVGKVLGYELSGKDGSASLRILIFAPYDALVLTGTRFWNTSGISVVAGSGGLRIQLESVQSVLTGGIAFDVPPGAEAGAVADGNAPFILYANETKAQDAAYTQRIYFMLHFTEPLPGLVNGSPVRLQGLIVGQVSDVHMEYDNSGKLVIPVTIEVEADRMKLQGDGSPITKANAYAVFHKLIASGLRARLGSGNLLTGQKVIDLDIVPGIPAMPQSIAGQYPEIPITQADDLDSIARSTKELLGKLQDTTTHLNDTLKQATSAISSDNEGGDLAGTLQEVKRAARSTRVLTDYLETHPEALLHGKPESAKP